MFSALFKLNGDAIHRKSLAFLRSSSCILLFIHPPTTGLRYLTCTWIQIELSSSDYNIVRQPKRDLVACLFTLLRFCGADRFQVQGPRRFPALDARPMASWVCRNDGQIFTLLVSPGVKVSVAFASCTNRISDQTLHLKNWGGRVIYHLVPCSTPPCRHGHRNRPRSSFSFNF